MTDIRKTICAAVPRELLIDLEDRLRAEAYSAYEVVRREFSLNAKRASEAEGQLRFRLQEQGYEEVVKSHNGYLLEGGVMLGTGLKIFQPFARFPGHGVGVILGFASMPEPKKIPSKNMSRAAGVALNVRLQLDLLHDEKSPKLTDIFVLFLVSRDRQRAGMIEEIAIGVIGADYKDFIFYQSLDAFLQGYGSDGTGGEGSPDPSGGGDMGGRVVKLRDTRKAFIPPEKQPDRTAEEEADG